MDRTIEPNGNAFAVYEHGVYPDSSVLAGQSQRSFLVDFATLAEAQAAYPNATALEYSTRPRIPEDASLVDISGLPECPPAWFDETDAGEVW